MLVRIGTSLILMCSLFVPFTHAGIFDRQPKWPEIPLPEKSELTVVMENAKVNGIPTQSFIMTSWQPLAKSIEFYRKSWATTESKLLKSGAVGYKENRLDNVHILSRIEGNFLITFQFDTNIEKTTKAILGISVLPGKRHRPARLGHGVLLDPQAEIMTDIEAIDDGKHSRTILASRKGNVSQCTRTYHSLYTGRGWTRLEGDSSGADNVLFLNKGRGEVNIVCTKSPEGTMVTLVKVNH